jgi:hypothetical protein
VNPFVNLKLHLCNITLRIYRNQNKNNFSLSVQFTNLTKRGNFEENMDVSRIYLAVSADFDIEKNLSTDFEVAKN